MPLQRFGVKGSGKRRRLRNAVFMRSGDKAVAGSVGTAVSHQAAAGPALERRSAEADWLKLASSAVWK